MLRHRIWKILESIYAQKANTINLQICGKYLNNWQKVWKGIVRREKKGVDWYPGGYKKMSSILADQQRRRIYDPKCGGGWLRGCCTVYTGAQTNFGDLTPYLTYGGTI